MQRHGVERFQSDLKRKDKTIDELREKSTIAGEKNNQDVAHCLKRGTGPTKEQAQHAISQVRKSAKSYCGSGRDQSYPSGTKSAASGEGLQV